MKRSRKILLILCLSLFIIGNLLAQTPNYEKLKKTNFLIQNTTTQEVGSGTLIKIKDDFYILTCAHLIVDLDDFIIGGNTITRVIYSLKLKKINKEIDLALFKFSDTSEQFDNYLEISNEDPEVGETIFAIGNPSIKNSYDVLVSGIISKKMKKETLTTALTYYGDSGGAVIYKDKMIGVLSKIDSNSAKLNNGGIVTISFGVFINLETIEEFLKDVE